MSRRFETIDTLRGISVCSMILYHFCWDLCYIARWRMPWYTSTPAYLWQQSICWSFILISGFCAAMAHHPIRDGLKVSVCGGIITAVTCLLLPEERVVFGVLTLHGAAMLLVGIGRKLLSGGRRTALTLTGDLSAAKDPVEHASKSPGSDRRLAAVWLAAAALVFITTKHLAAGFLGVFSLPLIQLPRFLFHGLFMTFLGFMDPSFVSTDYFPLLPWFAMFQCGYWLHRLFAPRIAVNREVPVLHVSVPPFSWIGRHALLIYLLHQPVLYALTLLLTLF
ncbi:MAG: DUF1624 domain-containing protein [Butyrivibrio sp.]|nr:DUF1624 domain-containing protein [Butyrivibrio sp.]